MSTTPSIASVVNDLRNQNQNLPTEKKQNIIVVQDNASASEADKTGQMLTVLNNIFNAVSEQLRLTRESFRLQKEESRLAAKDFQKEAMDVSSGKYEPQEYGGGGGGGASPAGGGGGVIEQAGKVGGGLWESAKGLGKAAVGVAARHPIATAIGAGVAVGGGIGLASKIKTTKDQDKNMLMVYDAFKNAGFSKNQAKALTAEVGRENAYNPKFLFGTHKDAAAHGGTNIGMFSWEHDRKNELMQRLEAKGLIKNGRISQSQEALNEMAAFARHEMETKSRFKSFKEKFLENPDIDPEEAAKYMGGKKGYVGWAYGQSVLRGGKSFDWRSHDARRRGYLQHLSKMTDKYKETDSPSKLNTSSKIQSQEEITTPPNYNQPTATKMVDTSDLKVKGGLKGQAFKGGETEQGILNLARTIQADEANLPGGLNRFSSFNDAYHLKANPKSKHTQGLAMDFSLKNAKYSSEAADYIKQKLLASGMTEEEFKIINEYKNPSKHATGGHIHVNFANKKAAEKFAQYSSGEVQQTKLASNEEQLPKTGRHQLERTDEKSSVLQASMFAPLEKAIDKMSNILTSIDKNTGKTEEHTKEIKTASKEEQTKTEEPTATKTETEETETPTATKAEEEQDQSQDLASMMGGSDEGSNVMKMLFGQGGFMGSAEPIEPGSAKRKYIDSLPSHTDKIGEMVRNFLLGEGDIDVNEALGALGQSGTATPQGTSNKLENLGVTPTMSQNFTEQPKNLGVTPISETEQFLNGLGITPFNNQQQETQLNYQKTNQLANLGVNPFGGQQGGMLNNIFSRGMPSAGNNPFYSMQGMLGRIGSVASMGQNIGGMMQQGGLGGARNVVGQVGGILQGMDSGFPMSQGIGGMMRNVGSIMGSVQGMQNIGRGGMGGVMGGIGAASGVLGSLGNIFGNVQGMSGGLGKMMGGLGVTPFGGGGSSGGSSLAGGLSSIGNSVGNLFGGIGDSIGGLFGGGSSSGGQDTGNMIADEAKKFFGGSISSKGIGDDAASLKKTYSESSEPMGGNLESLQSSNDELSSPSQASLSTDKGNTQPPGAGGGMPADRGSISSSQGASAAPKSGAGARTGTSSGAMGNSMEGYNDCPTLYKWQFRTSYWGKV